MFRPDLGLFANRNILWNSKQEKNNRRKSQFAYQIYDFLEQQYFIVSSQIKEKESPT